jgi:fibronectin-binding autotransporter adhesin
VSFIKLKEIQIMRYSSSQRTAAQIVIFVLLLSGSTVFAQITTLWTSVTAGSTNSWGTGANWNMGVPDVTMISGTATNGAVITNRVASYTVQYDTTTSPLNRLTLGAGSTVGSGILTLNVATNGQTSPVTMVITNVSGSNNGVSSLQLNGGGVLNVNTNGTLYYRGGMLQGDAQFNINGGTVVVHSFGSSEGVQTRLAFNSVFNLNSGSYTLSTNFATSFQVGANNQIDNATANFNGGTAVLGPMVIGTRGTGTVNVAGGFVTSSGSISLGGLQTAGANARAVGFLNVSGGVITNTGTLFLGDTTNKVGQTAAAVVTMTGGTFIQQGATTIGNRNTGKIDLSGGTFLAANSVTLGAIAESTGNLPGAGTLTISGTGVMVITNIAGSSTLEVRRGLLQLGGGTLTVDRLISTNVDLGSMSTITFNSGVLNVKTTQVANGKAFVVGNGVGAATLNLQGGGHTFGSGLTITNNAKLSGTGTISAAVTVADGGIVSPGNSAGTFVISSLTLTPGAILNYELGPTDGVNDFIKITGNLTLDGTLNIADLGGFSTGTYLLITYDGILTDNGLLVGTVPGGLSASIDTSTAGQVYLVVPEPSAFVLTLTGLLAGWGMLRKARKS